MKKLAQYNREETFQLLHRKSWNELIELFKNNEIYSDIQADEITRTIIDRDFINELISGNSFQGDNDYLFYLEQFYILHIDDRNYLFKLSKENLHKLIEKIVTGYKTINLPTALRYAYRFPNLSICKELITDNQRTQPKVVDHSQATTINVTENEEVESIDATISLFKSKLEYEFYAAVRLTYSTYMVFPNVALSSFIDFEQIKASLSQEERNYFFRGLVDCVVFDQANSFKPLILIEIDSVYHDSNEQKIKDRMKDKIVAKAGKKLYRIRKIGSLTDQDNLTMLIRETVK